MVYGANNTDAEPITLQDVSITVADGPSQRETTVITDAEGLANLVDLSPGTYQFFVWHPEFGPPRPGQPHWVTVAPGEEKVSNVYLSQVGLPDIPGQPIQYTLTGIALKAGELNQTAQADQDHSGISVRVRTEDEVPTSIETTTTSDGAFGLALNPGVYKLYFNAPNHTETGPITTTVVSDEMTVLEESIVLNINPGRIIGQIKLEGRADVEHGDVTISLSNTSFTALTSEDGGFQLTDLPAGAHITGKQTTSNRLICRASSLMERLKPILANSLWRNPWYLSGRFQLAGAQTSAFKSV